MVERMEAAKASPHYLESRSMPAMRAASLGCWLHVGAIRARPPMSARTVGDGDSGKHDIAVSRPRSPSWRTRSRRSTTQGRPVIAGHASTVQLRDRRQARVTFANGRRVNSVRTSSRTEGAEPQELECRSRGVNLGETA